MPTEIIQWIQTASTPVLGLVIFGGYKVLGVLHSIDRRLLRVETKLEIDTDEKF